jgi:hypothetical protein
MASRRVDGLNCYSGGAWYRKNVTLTPEQARGGITLDLGKVVSSAVTSSRGEFFQENVWNLVPGGAGSAQ